MRAPALAVGRRGNNLQFEMTGRQAHRALTLVFSLLMGAIGVALIGQALLSSSPLSARLILGVLFIAGVQKIPATLYDASRVDGAGALREFLTVTVPGLRHEIVVALVLTTSGALGSFDLVYVATSGGPGTSTTVPAWFIYTQAFVVGQIGAAAALGVLLTLLIFAVTFLITRVGGG